MCNVKKSQNKLIREISFCPKGMGYDIIYAISTVKGVNMLIQLRVNNFLSFGEMTTFSLEAGKIQKHKNHISRIRQRQILRGCSIFGSNAAGKSNLLKALALIERMMIDNSCGAVAGRQFRLGKEQRPNMEICIEYEYNEHVFCYQIITDGLTVKQEILLCLDSEDPETLFSRKNEVITLGERLKEYLWYEQRTCKSDAFYLMKLAQDGLRENRKTIPESKLMIDACWGMKQFIVIDASQHSFLAEKYYAKLQIDEFRRFLIDLLKSADMGISDVDYRKLSSHEAENILRKYQGVIPDELHDGWSKVVLDSPAYYLLTFDGSKFAVREICCKHGAFPFRAGEESQGTIKLIQLSSMLFQLKTSKMVWCVDEFDSKFHTVLSQNLLKWYMDESEGIRSQLIVSAHDMNLLTHDIWRTDEIYLVEKKNNHSLLTRLDTKCPRFDKRLAKGYLKGDYGTLPNVQFAKIGT